MNIIDKKIKRVESLIDRLSNSENNLQYITRLMSLYKRLDDLFATIYEDKRYNTAFEKYFGTASFGISYFERISNAVVDYKYHNNKPF